MRAGLYARVSTHDQQTLSLQVSAMQLYAQQRGWDPVLCIEEVGSGTQERMQRKAILQAAQRRDIDVVIVWRLDRWGRSVVDLLSTLQEFSELGVGFVSITEAFDLTTSTGRGSTSRPASKGWPNPAASTSPVPCSRKPGTRSRSASRNWALGGSRTSPSPFMSIGYCSTPVPPEPCVPRSRHRLVAGVDTPW